MGLNLASWAVHPLALLLIVGVALLASQTAVVVGHPTALVTGTGSLGTKSSRYVSRIISRIISRVKNRSNKTVASRVIARVSTSWIIAGVTSTRIVPRAPTIPSRVIARLYISSLIVART